MTASDGSLSDTAAITVNLNNRNDPPTGVVTLTGTATVAQTLTADPSTIADGDGLGAFSYQWQRSADGVAWISVGGATGPSYVLTATDLGNRMRVVVSYTDAQGSVESLSSAGSAVVVPAGTTVSPPTTTGSDGSRAETETTGTNPPGTTLGERSQPVPTPPAPRTPADLENTKARDQRIADPHSGAAVTENEAGATETVQSTLDSPAPRRRGEASLQPFVRAALQDWIDLHAPPDSLELAPPPNLELASSSIAALRRGDEIKVASSQAQEDAPADRGGLTNDPVRLATSVLVAGALLWLVRSSGWTSLLVMGMPIWRHVDLLAIVEREEEDGPARARIPKAAPGGEAELEEQAAATVLDERALDPHGAAS
ncbi:MAG: hypothetical protein ACKVQT_34450 [Burkholderiales bacterium]